MKGCNTTTWKGFWKKCKKSPNFSNPHEIIANANIRDKCSRKAKHKADYNPNWKLEPIDIKGLHPRHDKGPQPQSGTSTPSKSAAECYHSSGGFLLASNMTDFYETWNLSLFSSNEHIKNVIKDPSSSQEPPCPPELQQSVIILQEGSWWLQTWRIFMKLET